MSLRNAVLALGAACLLAGLIALVLGAVGAALMFGAWGVCLLVGTLYERIRYKPLAGRAPGPGWERTAERFVDPQSGQPVTVYADPATGERRYVQE